MHDAEGIIKFAAEHAEREPTPELDHAARVLAPWRTILRRLGVLGRDAQRYDGLGFGNLSLRLPPADAPVGARRFAVSGVQTAGLELATGQHFAVIERWDIRHNRVISHGPSLPSSESMTHAAAYDLDLSIGAVFHVHSRALWRQARSLGIPCTDANIAYGTQEMAREVGRLWQRQSLRDIGIFAMGGHEDGIVAVGRTPQDTGTRLIRYL